MRRKNVRRCAKRQIHYDEEKHDQFFENTPGYTDFGRTRKGGDKRPNAAGQTNPIPNTIFLFGQTSR